MARGWESKSVAEQMEDKEKLQPGAEANLSALERERRARLESLRLSRARTLDQLSRATHPAHRQMLKRALKALETEEASLQEDPS